jgi:hypothetical protein
MRRKKKNWKRKRERGKESSFLSICVCLMPSGEGEKDFFQVTATAAISSPKVRKPRERVISFLFPSFPLFQRPLQAHAKISSTELRPSPMSATAAAAQGDLTHPGRLFSPPLGSHFA